MAQEIMVAGAIYEGVPTVRLPDSDGVFHPFTDTSDTTAVAADVAQGKLFHLADGALATGTASGGGGGGASNVVTGTFVAGDSKDEDNGVLSIPYSGNGYPLQLCIYVDGGTNDNPEWTNVISKGAVGLFAASKAYKEVEPTYSGYSTGNLYTAVAVVKNQTATGSSVGGVFGQNIASGRPSSDYGYPHRSVSFSASTRILYAMTEAGSTDYNAGLLSGVTYGYMVMYSE